MKTLRNVLKSLAWALIVAVLCILVIGAVVTTLMAALHHFGVWAIAFIFFVGLWGMVYSDMRNEGRLE